MLYTPRAEMGCDEWHVLPECKALLRVAANGGVPGAHACALGCNGAPRLARSAVP